MDAVSLLIGSLTAIGAFIGYRITLRLLKLTKYKAVIYKSIEGVWHLIGILTIAITFRFNEVTTITIALITTAYLLTHQIVWRIWNKTLTGFLPRPRMTNIIMYPFWWAVLFLLINQLIEITQQNFDLSLSYVATKILNDSISIMLYVFSYAVLGYMLTIESIKQTKVLYGFISIITVGFTMLVAVHMVKDIKVFSFVVLGSVGLLAGHTLLPKGISKLTSLLD